MWAELETCWLDESRAMLFGIAALATNRLTSIYIDGGVRPVKLFRQGTVKFLINGLAGFVSN